MDLEKKILSDVTVHMKYARYIESENRRENWHELVTRNMNMHIKKFPNLQPEIENASLNKSVMGSASTFDSYINKVNLRLNKSLFQNGKRELMFSTSYSFSSYAHNPNKDYWSGSTVFTYKWGSYKNIKYLNDFI